jgi:hypothetical protein
MIHVEIELLVMREGMLVLCTLDMASARWQKITRNDTQSAYL